MSPPGNGLPKEDYVRRPGLKLTSLSEEKEIMKVKGASQPKGERM
jgi:hypothetical protein